MKHVLSKSTFMYGIQCPKRLYLHKFQKELRNPLDEQQESIFQSGTDIGKLAQALFPGGVDLSPPNPFSYVLSVKQTEKHIQSHSILYEAAFQFEGILCAIDILVRVGNQWHAFEVKSTNSVKEQHVLDAALQYYVIKNCGLPIVDFSIIHFNRSYIRKETIELDALFTSKSILKEIKKQQKFIQTKAAEFKQLLQTKIQPEIEPGDFCFIPYTCDFTQHCIGETPAPEAYEPNIHLNRSEIDSFLAQLKLPYYFLDFESVMYGVPEFPESRPYQQIPFQYSLHIQQTFTGKIAHHTFLGDGISDPREACIQKLIRDLGKDGSIICYNMHFEKKCIEEFARDFPNYKKELHALIPRLIDLAIPFRNKWIHDPQWGRKYTLKLVLPSLIPSLDYSSLPVSDGSMASFIYSQLQYQDASTQERQRTELLSYCHLDTLAMVKILEWMHEETHIKIKTKSVKKAKSTNK